MATIKKKMKSRKATSTKVKPRTSKNRTSAKKPGKSQLKKIKKVSKRQSKKVKVIKKKKPKRVSKKPVNKIEFLESTNSPDVSNKIVLPSITQRRSVSLNQTVEMEKITFYLGELIESIKSGTVCIQQGENLVTLRPGQIVDFEVEASSKKGKEKLVLELSWRTGREGEKGEFKIMPQEPAK